MKYISTAEWRDNKDYHLYREGDPFPFDGREIPAERLAELESGRNRAGIRLIRADEAKDEPKATEAEKGPETAPEAQETASDKPAKKPAKPRKTTRK